MPLKPADRKAFISDLGAALSSGKYHKIKGEVYFDSLYSLITPEDVTIYGKSDIAHHNQMEVYPNSEELVGTYTDFLNLDIFAWNDKGYQAWLDIKYRSYYYY